MLRMTKCIKIKVKYTFVSKVQRFGNTWFQKDGAATQNKQCLKNCFTAVLLKTIDNNYSICFSIFILFYYIFSAAKTYKKIKLC